MHKSILIAALLFLTTYTYGQESVQQKFKKIQWLVGNWKRTNAKPEHSGYENWQRVSTSKLTGKGVTLKGKKVIFIEKLEFSIKGNDLFYIVSVTGEKRPVYFKLTKIDEEGFTCENPEHDFPKKISYQRNGDQIKAVISGDGKSVDYDFEKIQKPVKKSS